jgi:alpha-N-acetylglucosaminidase
MIILDLWSESHPVWNRTNAYYGKPWIWNMLHNFGGGTYLEGCMPCVTHQPAGLLNNPKAGKLAGLGLTMEGTEQNPAIYQLMLDNTWRNTPIDLNKWIVRYVHQRYGTLNPDAVRAWQLLIHSVYTKAPGGFGGPESVITMRPRFMTFKNQENIFDYNNDSLSLAWKLLLKAAPALHHNDGYQYDLVNTGRQVLANNAVLLEQKIAKAYDDKNTNAFEQWSKQYLSLINDMNTLLGTRKDFLLGKWIGAARSWGKTTSKKNLYEFNARDLITLWGNKTSTLHDYARKQWNGLLTSFYKQRWEQFFVYALKCLKENKKLDMGYFDNQIENWEWGWVNSHHVYQKFPAGNPVNVSILMYNKYAKGFKADIIR